MLKLSTFRTGVCEIAAVEQAFNVHTVRRRKYHVKESEDDIEEIEGKRQARRPR
jgi:hypothetical protein